jgi:hypothetical protein
MNQEVQRKKRRRWPFILLLLLGLVLAIYVALVYPAAKAAIAARDQQRLEANKPLH